MEDENQDLLNWWAFNAQALIQSFPFVIYFLLKPKMCAQRVSSSYMLYSSSVCQMSNLNLKLYTLRWAS